MDALRQDLTLDPANPGSRGGHFLYLVGRLKHGVTFARAKADVESMLAQWGMLNSKTHVPDQKTHRLRMDPLDDVFGESVSRPRFLAQLLGLFAAPVGGRAGRRVLENEVGRWAARPLHSTPVDPEQDIDRLILELNATPDRDHLQAPLGTTARLEQWLQILAEKHGTDLLLVAGAPPSMRLDG